MFYPLLILKFENFVCRILSLSLEITRVDIYFSRKLMENKKKISLKIIIGVNTAHRHTEAPISDAEQQMQTYKIAGDFWLIPTNRKQN